MDVGSFVVEADGIRWAVDPGMHEYHSLESQGIKLWDGRQGGERWHVFRLGPGAHNILRFENHHQRVSAHADIITSKGTGTWPHTLLDLTAIYEGQVQTLKRGAALPSAGGFAIRDEWETGNQATRIAWQWLTYASAEVTKTGFNLHQAGKTLNIHLENSAPRETIVEDVTEPPGAFGEKNPGLTRISVQLSTASNTSGFLSAFFSTNHLPPIHQALSEW